MFFKCWRWDLSGSGMKDVSEAGVNEMDRMMLLVEEKTIS